MVVSLKEHRVGCHSRTNEKTTPGSCAPSVAFFQADLYPIFGRTYLREYFSRNAAIKSGYLCGSRRREPRRSPQ